MSLPISLVKAWAAVHLAPRMRISCAFFVFFHLPDCLNPIQSGGGGGTNRTPPSLAFPTISSNWIKIMTPKLVTFRQML